MVRALREELYNRDGHLVLNPYEKFLQTAKAWAGARKAENDAILAAELAAEEAGVIGLHTCFLAAAPLALPPWE